MKPPSNRVHLVQSILLISLLLALPPVLGGCAGGAPIREGTQRELLWPPLPMEPRIQWVQEIHDYNDVGIVKGFWKRVVELVAGATENKIGKPYGVYVDGQERLLIVDVGFARVHVMDLKNKSYSVIGEGEKDVFRTPIAVTEDDDENAYITDSSAAKVYRYSFRDKILQPFVTGNLDRPTGIAYNRGNKLLYVTDTGRHQVVIFDLKGNERFRIGGRGEGAGQFNYPTDLFIDSQGRLYVTDVLNARVQTFAANGALLGSFGQAGDSAGRFAKPKGVAVDSEGHIYVCDALLDTVQIFDASGQLLLDFGGTGTEAGKFWMPSGLFIDQNNTIYVSDSYNRRVQVFKYLKLEESKMTGKAVKSGP